MRCGPRVFERMGEPDAMIVLGSAKLRNGYAESRKIRNYSIWTLFTIYIYDNILDSKYDIRR